MENKKKRRGMLAVLLGLVLTVCGGALTLTVGGRLEYILPAPAATQEGGELRRSAEADSLHRRFDHGRGGRRAGAGGQSLRGGAERGGDGLRGRLGLFRRDA